jgi:hypothetical protein
MDERGGQEGLWLGEDGPPSPTRGRRGRQLWVVGASVLCVAGISIPLALAFSSNGAPTPAPRATETHHLGHGAAEHEVISALGATTSSGSFNVNYEFDPATAPTTPTTTTTFPCPQSTGASCPVMGGPVSTEGGTPTTGHGTIDTDPFAMVAVSQVSGLGQITLRDNGTDVWEFGGADYGLSPGSSENGPGSTLSGFAGLVEGTLGQRQGALAMGGLASPTGYLDLEESEITGASQIGTGMVDGVAVTIYQVSLNAGQEPSASSLTSQEAEAISQSQAVLQSDGYQGTTVQVSIDASGYIRQTRSVAHFSDGSTTSSEATFSDFGCAGTVLMPGQQGTTTPPAGCVSPDTGVAPTTTTTSTTVAPTTTTPSTTTTFPPPPSTTEPTTTTTSSMAPPAG